MSRTTRRRIGRTGELVALVYLLAKGYRARHRNWRGPGGEIDLVLERRGVIVFVEVKLRSDPAYGGAAAAVDAEKRRRLVRAAAAYLGRYELWDRPTRFDVLTLERRGGPIPWRVRHMPHAFRADTGRIL